MIEGAGKTKSPPVAPAAAPEDAALVSRSGLFDPSWYLSANPDVAAAGGDPLDHYLLHGGFEGRPASPMFDSQRYLRENRDVAEARINPLVHYLRHGWREGRRPLAAIDGERLRNVPWNEAAGEPHPLVAAIAAQRLPDFLFRQWREAADLDPAIRPEPGPHLSLPIIRFPRAESLVGALERIRADHPGGFSHVVAAPLMVRGGAELVSAHVVRALAERHGTEAVLFLVTDRPDRSAADWLPPGTRSLYFRDYAPEATLPEIDALFTQFVMQYRPRAIVDINSAACWRMFERHGRQFATFARLYAFLFGYGYTADGLKFGPAVNHFRNCLPNLSGMCFDSQYFRRVMIEQYGVVRGDRARLHTVYTPVQEPMRTIDVDALTARLGRPRALRRRILWASRVAPEKIPEMLLEIARAQPNMDFVAYGDAVLGADNPLRDAMLPNFEYRGGYTNFFDLPLEEFDAFLYTSRSDGVPTVLIAAQAAGLPIVASAVGGVPELVTDETGWPIAPGADPAAYCAALDEATHGPERSRAKLEAGLALSRRRHRWPGFVAQLEATGLLAR